MKISQIIQDQKTTANCSDKPPSDEYISKLRILLSTTIKDIVPSFVYDNYNTEIFKNLFLYYTKQQGAYDLSRGLWLMGGNGTGKTTLLQIFSEFGKRRYDGFRIYDCAKVANDYAMNGDLDVYTYNRTGYSRKPVDMAFDELGRETNPANHFGQKLNVMQHILHIRYNLWRSNGIQTYITTNCDYDEIHDLYDSKNDRFISDRCREMYNIIHLDSDSRRK